MKYIIGLIIGLIMTAFLAYGENLTYTIAQMQALLDSVNARVSTSAGAADAGKMVVLDAAGELDTTLYSGGGAGTVDTTGTPVDNDWPKFTDANTLEGRSNAEILGDLSLDIGTDVQAYDADLDTYAGLTPSANVQSFLGSTDYADMKVRMDLEIGVDVEAYDASNTVLGATIGAAEVDADVATQAELDAVAALVDTDDEIIAIINASPGTYVDVAAGGTGVGTLALNGVLYGKAGADVGVTAIGAAGSILVAGADPFVPVFSAGTGTGVPVRAADAAFTGFPTTPASAPDADYEVANKKYIDDAVIAAGSGDVTSVGDCTDGVCFDGGALNGTYLRLYDGDSHYVQIAVPDVAGNVTITTPAVTSTLLAADGTGASLTAVDAVTGDSATAFFDAGTIEHERGGLEADVSAYSGLVGITGGATTEVNTAAELETFAGLGAFANEILDDANAAAVLVTIGAEAADATIIKEAEVDDTPVNGVTTEPVSSNWAFDHAAANDAHSTYLLKSQIGAAYDTEGELDALFLAKEDALDNSAGLLAALDDETGTGVAVFSTTPTLVTPVLGAATATTLDTGQGANELYDMDQNVLTTSSPTFVAVTVSGAAGNGGFEIDPGPDTDETCEGIISTVTAGVSGILVGHCLTIDASAEYVFANANSEDTRCVAIACEDASDQDAFEVMTYGYVREDSLFDFTPNDLIYLEETNGLVIDEDDTLPADTGDIHQIVGYATSADIFLFNPQLYYNKIN